MHKTTSKTFYKSKKHLFRTSPLELYQEHGLESLGR